MLQIRVILGLLTFSMLFMYQFSRFNINIAIIAMIHEAKNNGTSTSYWNGREIILGSFFYLCWITELLGNYLLIKFSCRRVLAIVFVLNAVTCFVFPICYRIHPIFGAVIRVIQGLVLGPTWPAMAFISSRWIPKNERSRFMSTYHGATFGASCSNLLGGFIISYLGWPYVFYSSGILSIIWVLFWCFFAYDSPSLHPRISKEELQYLEKYVEVNINKDKTNTNRKIPWLRIFTSVPFWVVFLMIISLFWFVISLAMEMPLYLDMVHNVNIRTNGILLSVPDFLKVIVGIYFPVFIDKLIKKNKITICTARKLSCAIGNLIPGILLTVMAYYGPVSVELSTILIILCVGINGAGSSSILANVVDIAPNFAGITMGISKTVSNLAGILSPLLVKYILADNKDNWTMILLLNAAVLIISYVIYFFFTSTDPQPWNFVEEEKQDKNDNKLDKTEKAETPETTVEEDIALNKTREY